ncbi:MAG: hypothetical protein ABIY63_08815, partial [Fibrobacteria bacterium]
MGSAKDRRAARILTALLLVASLSAPAAAAPAAAAPAAAAAVADSGEYRAVPAFEGASVTALCRSGTRVYAALLKGGLWKSDDEGETWQRTPGDPTGGL